MAASVQKDTPTGTKAGTMPADDELARAADPGNWTDFNVTFFLDPGRRAAAIELAAELRTRGWESETLENEDIESVVVRGYRLLTDEHEIDSLDVFDDEMEELATRYGAKYDGSGVSIRQVDT
jgi:Regulator of ribonuclease activity B